MPKVKKEKEEDEESNSGAKTFLEIVVQREEGEDMEQNRQLEGNFAGTRWVVDHDADQSESEMEDHVFISISKYYELEISGKLAQKQTKMSEKDMLKRQGQCKQAMFNCYCGKSFKLKYKFITHIEQSHSYRVDSLAYLHNRNQFSRKNIIIAHYKDQNIMYLQKIKKCPYNQLMLPEQLVNCVSSQLKTKISRNAKQIFAIRCGLSDRLASQRHQIQLRNGNTYYFSSAFMEYIRSIVRRNIEIFNRRTEIYFKNMCFKEILFLFTYNIVMVVFVMNKGKNSKDFIQWSHFMECFCKQFIDWINKKYQKIFQLNNIFYNHIQLLPGQKYAQTERPNNYKHFIRQYEKKLNSKDYSRIEFKSAILFLSSFQDFMEELSIGLRI